MRNQPRGHAAHKERGRHLSAARLRRRARLAGCRRLIAQRAVLRVTPSILKGFEHSILPCGEGLSVCCLPSRGTSSTPAHGSHRHSAAAQRPAGDHGSSSCWESYSASQAIYIEALAPKWAEPPLPPAKARCLAPGMIALYCQERHSFTHLFLLILMTRKGTAASGYIDWGNLR